MLNLGIIFTVLVSLVPSQHGSPLQNKHIESILELLGGQKDQDVRKQRIESSSSDSSSDEVSTKNGIYGILKNMEVIDLIQNPNKDKGTSKSQHSKGREIHKHASNPVYRNFELNRHRDSDSQQIIEQLLQHLKKEKNQRLSPNNFLGPIKFEDDDEQEQTDGLNEYSKIFVLLDPVAIQKSKNKDDLSNLVSRILSLSSSSNEKARQERNKNHSYKGYKVNNNIFSRRYRRESKETYGGGRDSMEDDFKPKRSKNDRGGGGGGSGGRTAIPYIRQRGDIYERNN